MNDYLDVEEVATLIGVKPSTVHQYHKREEMPAADRYFGRSPAWKRSTIESWRPSPSEHAFDPTVKKKTQAERPLP